MVASGWQHGRSVRRRSHLRFIARNRLMMRLHFDSSLWLVIICRLSYALRLGSNSVLETLVHPLTHNGYHVLRYNARGVGDSSGVASFTGFQEAQDLKELVQYAVARLGGVQELLLVVCLLRAYPGLACSH